MTLAPGTQSTTTTTPDSWADLSGRWFFAWRMAAACEVALREVNVARASQSDLQCSDALDRASDLLQKELMQWVRRGEALDMIVDHLPRGAQ